eukprot:NODE_1215_length_951_cov_103.268204_g1169_i0.p1 GENE.NODE_1215_length_951_cov_103.268204_g1169_i0~~NODE_1215_length_951_cov_103.268204_g1169_i0.p1  ORF type:complete len:213 (-),score=37.93 NODE_1215_length_951_cov_103.268204_g1169_i0:127-765(-)
MTPPGTGVPPPLDRAPEFGEENRYPTDEYGSFAPSSPYDYHAYDAPGPYAIDPTMGSPTHVAQGMPAYGFPPPNMQRGYAEHGGYTEEPTDGYQDYMAAYPYQEFDGTQQMDMGYEDPNGYAPYHYEGHYTANQPYPNQMYDPQNYYSYMEYQGAEYDPNSYGYAAKGQSYYPPAPVPPPTSPQSMPNQNPRQPSSGYTAPAEDIEDIARDD